MNPKLLPLGCRNGLSLVIKGTPLFSNYSFLSTRKEVTGCTAHLGMVTLVLLPGSAVILAPTQFLNISSVQHLLIGC